MAQKTQLIAVTTFAKTVGVTRQAVDKWIKNDKLTVGKGLAKREKGKPHKIKLIPAAEQLLDNLDLDQPASLQLFEILTVLAGRKLLNIIDNPANDDPNKEPEVLTYMEAKRRHEVVKVKIAEVALEEKRKTLVNAEHVKKKVYGYGVEIRQALEQVPAKVIDNVLAAETRHAGLLIIKEAIDKALQKIHDIQERNL